MADMRLLLFIMAKNEEKQLEETVHGLQSVCPGEIVAGMVLYLAPDATQGCLHTARALQSEASRIPVEIFVQPSGDIPAGFKAVLNCRRDVTHVLFLMSDNNIEIEAVAGLIERAAADPNTVYKFSRALPGGRFSSQYSALEVRAYLLLCAFVRLLYCNGLTDHFFLVGIYPAGLFLRHEFKRITLLTYGAEFFCSLMREKVPTAEIPVVNMPRTEGRGTSNIRSRLGYLVIAVGVRFRGLNHSVKRSCDR